MKTITGLEDEHELKNEIEEDPLLSLLCMCNTGSHIIDRPWHRLK